MRQLLPTSVVCALVLLVSAAPIARQSSPSRDGGLVELDVSATDKNGPVTDLRQDEFQISDDGKKVDLKSFASVVAHGSMDSGDARDVVIVLDDAGVPSAGTQALQQIATLFARGAGPGDHVAAIRLHTATDDLSRDQQLALARIAAFQAGSIPFFAGETTEDLLRLVTKLSRQWLELAPHRRKAIVCVGSPGVCIPNERESSAPRDEYSTWRDALTAAGQSNVAVYAVIPARVNLIGGGLPEQTGGEGFAGLANFGPAVDQVYEHLSQYYMIGYVPAASKKDLRSVSVRVTRKGVSVHTRNKRGA